MYGRNSEHGPMVLFAERHEKKFGGVTLAKVFRDGCLYIAVKTEEQENKVLNSHIRGRFRKTISQSRAQQD